MSIATPGYVAGLPNSFTRVQQAQFCPKWGKSSFIGFPRQVSLSLGAHNFLPVSELMLHLSTNSLWAPIGSASWTQDQENGIQNGLKKEGNLSTGMKVGLGNWTIYLNTTLQNGVTFLLPHTNFKGNQTPVILFQACLSSDPLQQVLAQDQSQDIRPIFVLYSSGFHHPLFPWMSYGQDILRRPLPLVCDVPRLELDSPEHTWSPPGRHQENCRFEDHKLAYRMCQVLHHET